MRGLEIIQAKTREEALDFTSSFDTFGFVMLDVDNRITNPSELYQDICDIIGETPCIFFGTQSNIRVIIDDNVYTIHEHNDMLYRPFNRDGFRDELINKVNAAYEYASRIEFQESIVDVDPEDFTRLRLRSFYLHSSFPHDVYMEITKTKYIKVISAYKDFSHGHINQYAKKGVRYLFVEKDSHIEYLETEISKVMGKIDATANKDEKIHIHFLKGITLMHQTLHTLGLTDELKKLVEMIVDRIKEQSSYRSDLVDLLKSYPSVYKGVASKSLLTAYFSQKISREMGWESDMSQNKLVLAALIQDYCIQDDELSKVTGPNSKELYSYKEEEIKEFLNHPIKSAEIAKQFNAYTDLDDLVLNHHETPNRKGFPNKTSHLQLTPMNGVFNIAVYFATSLDGERINIEKLEQIFNYLNHHYNSGAFRDPLMALKKIVKLSFGRNKISA